MMDETVLGVNPRTYPNEVGPGHVTVKAVLLPLPRHSGKGEIP